MTHGVTQETANLNYENQPGALNESFSDVFGYFNDTEDWDIGEDITVSQPALRSLSNPTKYGQPDHYKIIETFRTLMPATTAACIQTAEFRTKPLTTRLQKSV